MKPDELAFANEQLAGMLKSGLPLEGSLRELTASMKSGSLRTELEALEKDLAKGTELPEALDKRDLPPLYIRMLKVGVKGGNLPEVLQCMADHYGRESTLWIRLKSLMIYPLLVLVVAIAFAFGVDWIGEEIWKIVSGTWPRDMPDPRREGLTGLLLWVPRIFLVLFALGALAVWALPGWRHNLRWQLPAFHEAALSQVAASVAMLLRSGCPLDEALGLVRELEGNSPGGIELGEWSDRLARGQGKPNEFAKGGVAFPSLFTWILKSGDEDLAAGFERAAEIYHTRAMNRADISLCYFWPLSILTIGYVVGSQTIISFLPLIRMMDSLGSE
jgi:type II secretory pathway component PulF